MCSYVVGEETFSNSKVTLREMPDGSVVVAMTLDSKTILMGRIGQTGLTRIANLAGVSSTIMVDRSLVTGYDNGLLRVISLTGSTEERQFVLHGSGIQQIRYTRSRHVDFVWVLYGDKTLLRVPLKDLLITSSWCEVDSVKIWKLKGQESIFAFAPMKSSPFHRHDLMLQEAVDDSCTIFTTGIKPSWSMYITEDNQAATKTDASLGGLVSAVATSLSSSVSTYAKTWMDSKFPTRSQNSPASKKKEIPLSHGIYDSASRVFSGQINDEHPRYCVTVDQIGRVVLVDTAGLRIMKMWKGYRDAHTGWITIPEHPLEDDSTKESKEGSTSKQVRRYGNYLAILAPQRQTIQLWRVPGCILVASFRITDGDCSLVTLTHRNGLFSCFVVRRQGLSVSISEIKLAFENVEHVFGQIDRGQHGGGFLIRKFRKCLSQKDIQGAVDTMKLVKEIPVLTELIRAIDEWIPQFLDAHMHLKVTVAAIQSANAIATDHVHEESISSAPNSEYIKHHQMDIKTEMFRGLLKKRKLFIEMYLGLLSEFDEEYTIEDTSHDLYNMLPPSQYYIAAPVAPLPIAQFLKAYKVNSRDEAFASLLFGSLLHNAFAFPKFQSAVDALKVSQADLVDLFLLWWYSLDIFSVVHYMENSGWGVYRFLQTQLEKPGFVESVTATWRQSPRVTHALMLVRCLEHSVVQYLRKSESQFIGNLQLELHEWSCKLADLLYIVAHIDDSTPTLSLDLLETLSYSNVFARATVAGAPHLDMLISRFHRLHKENHDSICCFQALMLADANHLKLALHEVYQVKHCKTRGGLSLRIFRDHALPRIKQAVNDPGTPTWLLLLCDECADLLVLIDNAIKEEEAQEDELEQDEFIEGLRSELATGVSEASVKGQQTVLKALKALAALTESDMPLSDLLHALFPEGMTLGCLTSAVPPLPAKGTPGRDLIDSRRMKLVSKSLRLSPSFDLASALELTMDAVRGDYVQLLYRQGLDSAGEEVLSQIEDQASVGLELLAVARVRMATILNGVQQSPKYRHLLAVISADTTRWIRAGGQEKSVEPVASLSSTLMLLQRLLDMIPVGNTAYNRALQLARAADALWRRIQEIR